MSADVADAAALRAGLTRARALFGPIEGVFHAAGTRDDGLARDRTWESVEAVLAPKVRGTVVLDRLTRDDPLAFFVCFSSTAGVLGPIGQAGYAAANGFLDGFAEARKGPGRSLSVGWPLWAEGGMRPPAEVWDDIARTTGLEPLPTAAALDVLWAGLASDLRRVTVLYGDRARLTRWLDQPVAVAHPAAVPTGQGALDFMANVLAEVAKLPVERFDADAPLESYGIDSMMIVRLNAVLERDLGETSKTLFFEHRTARGVAERLAERHPAAFGPAAVVAAPAPAPQARQRSGDIAIIGLAGQFPGAADLDAFWHVLDEGRDCITEIPVDRWPLAGFYDPDRDNPRTSYSKWGGFIDGVDQFDPRFFGLSPVEAESLDPAIRKFMEAAWWALEDAGLGRDQAFGGDPRRRGGVFAGVMHGDYQLFGAAEAARGKLAITTSAYWNIANRVSHFLDFRGPSLAVDSACSASLTALHLACQSLRGGECDIALAGGVNVSIHPNKYWTLSKAGFASSDGRCRSFGAGGDGYVPGEGVGCAVLKPLEAALADGDRVHAVIRGSAINHGGRTSGYTVPNPVAQGDLIAEALERAATPPDTISYVEAHGTGTALGDPVEIAGLRRAFAGLPAGGLPIGSVKSNIGHLEAAAGIAAVAKVVLQMRHRRLVPSLHADPLNPGLDLAGSPFVVQGASAAWTGRPLRAGISSFGAGGANAHLVIEEAPDQAPAPAPASGGPRVLTLSAAAPESLRAMAGRLAAHLRVTEAPLHDVARTLQSRREAFRHRLAVVADTAAEAARRLDLWLAGEAVDLSSGPQDAAARAWMAGEAVDWAALCPDAWRVVSLPPYPFALRRCWYQTVQPDPLVDGRLGADDAWLVDHQVAGRPVLAGAVQVAFALGALEAPVALSGLVWRRAVAAGEGVTLTVDGATVSADGEPCLSAAPAPAEPPPEVPDVAAVRARCPRVVPGAEALAALASAGAVYGPRFQALDQVCIGDGEALADLRPAARQPVDPGQLDAVLQAAFAVLPDDLAGPLLPAAVDRLTWWRSPEGAAVAWLRRRSSDRNGMVLDVVVSDGAGVCAAFDGLILRRPADPLPPLRVLVEAWEPVAVEAPVGAPVLVIGDGAWLADAAHRLPLEASDEAIRAVLPKVAEVVFLGGFRPEAGAVRHATVAADEETVVRPLFRLLRLLAAEGWPVALRVVTCGAQRVAGERLDPWAAAVTALAKAAAHEHPEATVRLIDLDGPEADAALAVCAVPSDAELAWREGRMLVKRLAEADPAGSSLAPGGVAVIAGAGGIGLTLAGHLALRRGMAVALIGRSAPSGDRLRRIEQITAAGGRVLAVQADLADPAAVAEAVRRIRAELGPVRLAVHAAMVLDDAPLVAHDWDRFRAVLRPKTLGLAGFVEALADQPPETLLLFSSANAHTANRGQAAYAAASAFEDAYGRALEETRVRIIDWGLWGESGRMADPAALAGLSRMGVHPLSDAEGLDLAERAVTGALPRLLPMRARPEILAAMGWRPAGARGAVEAALAAEQARAEVPDTIDGEAVNALARERVALEVLDLGLLLPGEAVDPAILGARLEDRGGYRRLVGALADMLARHGVLEPADGGWKVTAEAFDRPLAERRAALARRRQALEDAQPAVAPYFALLEACVTRLPDVVAGRLKAVDVLFPGGSTALVDPIYRGNPVADHLQRLVAVAVVEAARAVSGRVPRILEVGAGTGGTTAFVLPALAEAGLEAQYCFTDVGRMFLDQARQRFADHPGLSFQVFDVERPGAPQGLGEFDIIIAANVIHATRDIAVSLGTLRALCAPGAVLVLNEANSVQDINTLTFGLTPGWWLFNDDAVRLPHGPVLSVAGWRRVLGRAGFGEALAASLPGAVDEGAFLQSVLVATADPGWVAPVARTEDRPQAAPAEGGLEAVVRREVAAALHMAEDEVDPDASFAEFGADSIISIELVRRLNAALNIELKSTALFNHSTVRALAAAIADEYGVGTKTRETGADRLRRLIARRDQAAPVNREREFLAREAGEGATDLKTLLQRLESGEVDLETALEAEVME